MQDRIIQTSHGDIAMTESTGSGTDIVLIHGNSSCKEAFSFQLQGEPGSKHHCIALDLPGHGQSGNAVDPENTYTMRGYANAILEAVDDVLPNRFVVVGWSLGGHIALEMLTLSDKVQGLVITGTPPISHDPALNDGAFLPFEPMALTGQEHLDDEEAQQYARATCGSRHYEDFLCEAVRRTDGKARSLMMASALRGEGADQRQIVETSPVPLAILNGAEDPMVNNEFLESIAFRNLWQNRVHRIPDAGHAPFRESPETFNRLLLAFIDDLTG